MPMQAYRSMNRGVLMERYRVSNAPASIYYIPNFVSEEEATFLWKQVYAAPQVKWTQLSNRRLQNWGGLPQPKGMIQEPLPKWLSEICVKISSLGVFGEKQPNHVLINEYAPGQGIMPHEDGPLYHPTVTTVSLGSHTLLDFYHPITDKCSAADLESRYLLSVLLEPNSLLVLTDDMYTGYLHGISEKTKDTITENVCNLEQLGAKISQGTVLQRSTRISLTIRNVPKALKIRLNI